MCMGRLSPNERGENILKSYTEKGICFVFNFLFLVFALIRASKSSILFNFFTVTFQPGLDLNGSHFTSDASCTQNQCL